MDYSFIPSKTVREYSEKNNIIYTDFEKAALIYHNIPILKTKHEKLNKIASETSDKQLKKQIEECIELAMEEIELFKQNSENNYIYIVRFDDYFKSKNNHKQGDHFEKIYGYNGYFFNYQLAYDFALKNCGANGFIIEKQGVASETFTPIGKCLYSPYLTSFDGKGVESFECYDFPIAKCYFNSLGEVLSIQSDEIENKDDLILDSVFNVKRFENAFVNIHHPFNCGDIIKYKGLLGMVLTHKDVWEKMVEKAKSEEKEDENYGYYYNAVVKVNLLAEDDAFTYYVSPMRLESYELKGDEKNKRLLEFCSDLVKEQVGLTESLESYEDYENAMG